MLQNSSSEESGKGKYNKMRRDVHRDSLEECEIKTKEGNNLNSTIYALHFNGLACYRRPKIKMQLKILLETISQYIKVVATKHTKMLCLYMKTTNCK